MRESSIAAVALVCAACGGGKPNLGDRVAYFMSEGQAMTGSAGSCLSELHEQYVPERHQSLRYAVGALLGVDVWWPDRTDCDQNLVQQGHCQVLDPNVQVLGGWSYRFPQLNPVSLDLLVELRASEPVVQGGFKVIVNGKEFSPFFQEGTSDEYTAIWFQKTTCGSTNDCLIPGFVSEVLLAPGEPTAVTATLRTPSGEHICGQMATHFIIDPPGLYSVEPWNAGNNSNMAYRIIAGPNVGSGTFRIATTAGKPVEGVLQVVIQ